MTGSRRDVTAQLVASNAMIEEDIGQWQLSPTPRWEASMVVVVVVSSRVAQGMSRGNDVRRSDYEF